LTILYCSPFCLFKTIITRILITEIIRRTGAKTLDFLEGVGAVFILLWKVNKNARYLFRDRHYFIRQMREIGVNSLPLISIIAVFTGAVSAWQAAYQLKGFVPLDYLGAATLTAIVIELGPVLTALVIAGRIGSSIAAELGTMKVTEQIDALESLALDPIRFLAVPRFFASLIMLPVLTIFADFIAVIGAFIVSNYLLDVSQNAYFDGMREAFIMRNILGGLAKSHFFGASTAILGCYVGFQTQGGAEGVGKSTIRAFVLSAASILVIDYIIATIVF